MRAPTNTAARDSEYTWLGPKGFSFGEVRLRIVVVFLAAFLTIGPLMFVASMMLFRLTAPGPVAMIFAILVGGGGGFVVARVVTKSIAQTLNSYRSIRYVAAGLVSEANAPREGLAAPVEYETSVVIPAAVPSIEYITDLWETK